MFLFFILIKCTDLDLFFNRTISITPATKLEEPKAILKAVKIEELPSLDMHTNVTQLVMKFSVIIVGKTLVIRSNRVDPIISTIPMKRENIFLLNSAVVGRRIIKILSNPRVKIAIGREIETIFCNAALQNSTGVP